MSARKIVNNGSCFGHVRPRTRTTKQRNIEVFIKSIKPITKFIEKRGASIFNAFKSVFTQADTSQLLALDFSKDIEIDQMKDNFNRLVDIDKHGDDIELRRKHCIDLTGLDGDNLVQFLTELRNFAKDMRNNTNELSNFSSYLSG